MKSNFYHAVALLYSQKL